MLNCGQSWIAAKRFILVEGIHEELISKFTETVNILKSGDPLKETTQIGPLARIDLADQLQRQVRESIKQGAELLLGGKQQDCFHEPTVLGDVQPGMPAFDEETFGPLAAMIKVKDENEAFKLSEKSRYGLGVTVCPTNINRATALAAEVSDGLFYQ